MVVGGVILLPQGETVLEQLFRRYGTGDDDAGGDRDENEKQVEHGLTSRTSSSGVCREATGLQRVIYLFV